MFWDRKITQTEAKALIIKTALLNMFKEETYFNICTIDKCLKVANIIPLQEEYDMLSALHCVKWYTMDKKTKKWVKDTVFKIFTSKPENFSEIENLEPTELNLIPN